MTVENHAAEQAVAGSPEADATRITAADRRALALPGLLAVLAAGFFAVLHGVAVGAAAGGDNTTATVLAWTVIVGTIATLLLGVVAVVSGRGRRWGALAVVLSLLANPFVLMRVLGFFGA